MKRSLASIFVAGVLALNAFSQVPATRYGTDFQFWSDAQITFPLSENWNAVLLLVGRFGNDLRTTVDGRIGMMITKRLNKKVTIGGGYLYRYANPTFTSHKFESRFFGVAYVSQPLGHKFTFTSRLMGQYEDWYSRPNDVVFETKFGIKREVSIANHRIEPFVSFEPVYDTKMRQVVVYRSQAGFSRALSKNLSTEIFYLRQDVPGKGTRPGKTNGIGTSLKVTAR